MLHLAVEEPPVLEDLLHGVDLRTAEQEGAEGRSHFAHFLHHGLEYLAYLVAVLGEVDVLELVDDDEQFHGIVGCKPVGEPENGADVLVVHVPCQRKYRVGLGIALGVEYEMGALQEPSGYVRVLSWSGGEGADARVSELKQQLADTPRRGHVDLGDGETLALDAHVEECLLDGGSLAAAGRLVDGDVLSRTHEIAQNGDVALPADEVLAGDVLVVYERRLHDLTNLFLCKNSKIFCRKDKKR